MDEMIARMKGVWNRTNVRNAHFGESGEREYMFGRYGHLVTSRIPVDGKVVLDFGCGGALLGIHLLERNAERYIGYDVSERSLRKATENLADTVAERNRDRISGDALVDLRLIDRVEWDFASERPDLVVCLACMLHFPTHGYLDCFLSACDGSGAHDLVLEFRRGAKTEFQMVPYLSMKSAAKACFTTEAYVTDHLPRYEAVEGEDDRSTRIVWYRRRER
jgi:SAM-dependent methyltransferase